MHGRKHSELENWVRHWEDSVDNLLIPTESQVGRYPDYVHFADYEGTLVARVEADDLLAEAPFDERAQFEARLRAADSVFVGNTDPDTARLLLRSCVLPVDDYEVGTQVWLTRVPKHGVFRRAIEREANRRDTEWRAAGQDPDN